MVTCQLTLRFGSEQRYDMMVGEGNSWTIGIISTTLGGGEFWGRSHGYGLLKRASAVQVKVISLGVTVFPQPSHHSAD